ncbi:putative oxidoreductase [Xylaria cf. heliscus]|nr:putative oxidoreductase [Xylaria cf. heliscus]
MMERALKQGANCCLTLSALLGNMTLLPSSAGYESSLASYFSGQEASLHPACIVSPETVEDVAKAVRALTCSTPPTEGKSACQFAIRSGGHAPAVNAANIDGGVTLDLRRLNTIVVNPSESTVSIGVGNTWDGVYNKLDALNLSVAGGRSAGVGVGGLSLGGGISFFGTRYGWTSDTVANFEVVLANGSIVNANAKENSDLHWALKGGSNNFGVVTRVDLEAFEQGPFWGGSLSYPNTVSGDVARVVANINSPDTYDEYAAVVLSWSYVPSLGTAISTKIAYTKAVENPPVFDGLTSLPTLSNTLSITNMSQLAVPSKQVNGQRQLWTTNTMVSSAAMINATYLRFNESIPSFTSVANISFGYTIEPLPPALYARHADTNPFGLGKNNESLLVGLLFAAWTDPKDDAQVDKAIRGLLNAIEDDSRRLNAYNPFQYLNYAGGWQNPIAGYGEESVTRLRNVAGKVDPHGVFARQVPGGFKLNW